MEVYRDVFGKIEPRFLIEDEFGPKFLKPIIEEFVKLRTTENTSENQKKP